MTNTKRPTIISALQTAKQRLEQAGIEDSDLEAEVLLRFALNTDRTHLYQNLNSSLADDVMTHFYRLVRRRLSHEPSAYITGHREFYGLDFMVNRDVLIPRPETETLVDAAIEAVNALRRTERKSAQFEPLIADIGTGSGAIAISLAVNLPDARFKAVDASSLALDVARENARRHGVEDRIEFVEGNLLEPLRTPVYLIVANLPYVKTEDWCTLSPELRLHEPRVALDGGADGLEPIRRLIEQASGCLLSDGAILVEFGIGQQAAILELARAHFASVTIRPDLGGRPRVLIAR